MLCKLKQVMIYFNNRLYRGNRCSKLDSGAFNAFWSPNMDPIAKLEINIKGEHLNYLPLWYSC